jgi:hypothetical protein
MAPKSNEQVDVIHTPELVALPNQALSIDCHIKALPLYIQPNTAASVILFESSVSPPENLGLLRVQVANIALLYPDFAGIEITGDRGSGFQCEVVYRGPSLQNAKLKLSMSFFKESHIRRRDMERKRNGRIYQIPPPCSTTTHCKKKCINWFSSQGCHIYHDLSLRRNILLPLVSMAHIEHPDDLLSLLNAKYNPMRFEDQLAK